MRDVRTAIDSAAAAAVAATASGIFALCYSMSLDDRRCPVCRIAAKIVTYSHNLRLRNGDQIFP